MTPKFIFRCITLVPLIILVILFSAMPLHSLIDCNQILFIGIIILAVLIMVGILITSFIIPNVYHQWINSDLLAIGCNVAFIVTLTIISCYLILFYNQTYPRSSAQTFNGVIYSKEMTGTSIYPWISYYYVDLRIAHKNIKFCNKKMYDYVKAGDKIHLTVQQGTFGWYYMLQLEDDQAMHSLLNL